MPSVQDVIVHCQKQVKKDPPAEKLLHYLSRLDRLRVTVEDLMHTGVGRTVNQLSRHEGEVGQYAARLVQKWKEMVSEENSDSEDSQSSSSEGESEDRDEEEEMHGHPRGKVKEEIPIQNITLNGISKKRQHSESDEFNEDSDDERRLCIADEVVNEARREKSKSKSPADASVKEEKMSPKEDSEDDEESFRLEFSKVDDSIKHKDPIKSERLSESDDSDYHTQVFQHKSQMENQNKHQKIHHDENEIQKNLEKRDKREHPHHTSKNEQKEHLRKHKSSSSKSKSSHKHHKSDKEKVKKEHNSSSSDKSEAKQSRNSEHRIKIKVEPRNEEEEMDQDFGDSHKSSKRKEKSHKRPKEKAEVYDNHSSKNHKSRKEDAKHKHKVKEDNKESDRKRKPEEISKRKSFSSPDRKKIKLEDSKYADRSLTKKPSIHIDEEINSTSGVNFEELLGCLDKNLTKTKDKHKDKNKKHSSSSTSGRKEKEEVIKLVKRNEVKKPEINKKRKHLESIIQPTLNISPNYKPPAAIALLSRPMMHPKSHLASLNVLESCDPGNYWEEKKMVSYANEAHADDALSSMMSSRSQRTKVFSGRSIGIKGAVPRLFDLCMQVIQENIGDLGYTGGVPFEILKPALERASAEQLFIIEEYNPYLIGSTDELWKFHCSREYRGRERLEMETWRELFERCKSERDEKFAIVRKKMLKKGEVAEPVRKAKLAYVEPIGGPRFNRQKAATIKNGMKSLKIKEEKGPRKGVGTSASVGFNNPTDSTRIVEEHAVIINPESRSGHGPVPSSSRGEPVAKYKPWKAPLMAKTMRFIKTLQRR